MTADVRYYSCVNDDCASCGRKVPVYRDEEATCRRCGWFMSAWREDDE